MKKIRYLFIVIVFTISLSSCGTMKSIENKNNYVQYAKVKVNKYLEVSGKLIDLNDSIITISVDGALAKYYRNKIIDYNKYIAPDPNLMQRDIVENTKNTASNTGFFVSMTVLSLIVTGLLSSGVL